MFNLLLYGDSIPKPLQKGLLTLLNPIFEFIYYPQIYVSFDSFPVEKNREAQGQSLLWGLLPPNLRSRDTSLENPMLDVF